MKAERTVKRELRELRKYIETPGADALTARIAWEIEQAIRWAREDVKDWPSPIYSAANCANLIREEVERGDIKI
jgi:hypothetical protein